MLAGLLAAALVIAAMVLLGEYTETRGRLLLTALALTAFCLSATAPSALLQRQRSQAATIGGLVASGAGFILVATGIWITPDSDAYWKATAIASILAASAFLISLLLLPELDRSLAATLSWIALSATLLVALLSLLGILAEVKFPAYWWAVFFALVSALASSVGVLVLRRRTPTAGG
jgi:hypothetical protein